MCFQMTRRNGYMVLGSKPGMAATGGCRWSLFPSLIRPAPPPTYPKPRTKQNRPKNPKQGQNRQPSLLVLPHRGPTPPQSQPPRIPNPNGALPRAQHHPPRRVSQPAPVIPFHSARRHYRRLQLRFPAAAVAASSPPEAAEAERDGEKRRKLYVSNLPWSLPAPEVEKLFAQCGTVKGVEVIKGKDGRNRGFAFITMSTTEEAAAAVEKLNASDVKGRTIKVEFSRSFRKPAQPAPPVVERHKLYVSNLPWKARAPDLKEFFSKFNPLSAKLVFNDGKSAGYGFVSFGTKDEAEAALTELDGKEILERPVRVRWREVDDKVDGVNADGEVKTANVEGARVYGSSDDGNEDKQE